MQSLDKSRYQKVGLEDARDVRLLLSANQSELRSLQSEFSGFTLFTFMFCLCKMRSSRTVIGSIWSLWNQSNRSLTFSSYFCQGVRYHITVSNSIPNPHGMCWNYVFNLNSLLSFCNEITTHKGFLDRIIESLDKFFIAQVHRSLRLFLALTQHISAEYQ